MIGSASTRSAARSSDGIGSALGLVRRPVRASGRVAMLLSVATWTAACSSPFGPGPEMVSVEYRNDSDASLRVGLTWEGDNSQGFVIAPHAQGHLAGVGPGWAKVFTLDCQPVAEVQLDYHLDTVSIDAQMRVSAISQETARSAPPLPIADPIEQTNGRICQATLP